MGMTPSPNDLAGNGTLGSYTPFQLWAGEKEIVTDHDPVAPNTTIAKYQVLAKNAAGQLVPHDPTASDETAKAVGVATQPIKTGAAAASIGYYVSAFLNHEALVWHASLDTLAKRKAAFVGTEIRVGALRGAA
ncbi:decorator protein [Burkholderia phage vB_BceS_AH2]|uniref:Decorator protein n=1 Tax=Burkholderia phage vB_BceS_AH2 TaxID=1133022 RepID=I6NPA0_9CAUD|nr:decorator protein [Burkholderia phage vB_BceS_AH2]AEY69573.1 decorator protein [Burkholderia phage vB_BceS_AH2]